MGIRLRRTVSGGIHGALGALLVAGLPAAAQEVEFGAQVRPRMEFRDPGTSPGDDGDLFTSMRVRASLLARLERGVGLFVQFQDVRIFGEETGTLTDYSADHLDLHQGYLEVATENGDDRARVGRQETGFGGERLVGAVGWTQQGRSFDGLRLTFRRGWGDLDLIGYRIGDSDGGTDVDDLDFLGGYAVLGGSFDLYGFHERGRGAQEVDRSTLGLRAHGDLAGVGYRLETSYQRGDVGEADVSAFMAGARLGISTAGGRGEVTLWYDYLSGDDDPADGEIKVFDTLFATNHKFYGYADLFLNIPAHTAGRGLQDLALKTSWDVGRQVSLAADLHSFRLAEELPGGETHLGEEIDVTALYRYTSQLSLQAGVSYVLQDEALGTIGRLDRDMTFVYVMFDAAF